MFTKAVADISRLTGRPNDHVFQCVVAIGILSLSRLYGKGVSGNVSPAKVMQDARQFSAGAGPLEIASIAHALVINSDAKMRTWLEQFGPAPDAAAYQHDIKMSRDLIAKAIGDLEAQMTNTPEGT